MNSGYLGALHPRRLEDSRPRVHVDLHEETARLQVLTSQLFENCFSLPLLRLRPIPFQRELGLFSLPLNLTSPSPEKSMATLLTITATLLISLNQLTIELIRVFYLQYFLFIFLKKSFSYKHYLNLILMDHPNIIIVT